MAKKAGTARDGNAKVSERSKQTVPATLGGATLGWGKRAINLLALASQEGRKDMM